jgi:hypothetical protein
MPCYRSGEPAEVVPGSTERGSDEQRQIGLVDYWGVAGRCVTKDVLAAHHKPCPRLHDRTRARARADESTPRSVRNKATSSMISSVL